MEIPFQGALTKEEFLHLVKLSARPILKRPGVTFDLWMLFLMASGVLALIGVALFLRGLENPLVGLSLLILSVVALVMAIKLQRVPMKLWETNAVFQAHREGFITDEGIELNASSGHLRLRWEELSGYGEHEGVLVLFQGTAIAIPFSRKLFKDDQDWNSFRGRVTERLMPSHRVTPLTRSRMLVWIIIAIAIVSLAIQILRDFGAR